MIKIIGVFVIIILTILIVLDSILILGILFDLESWFDNQFSKEIIKSLKKQYATNKGFNFVNTVSSLGILIGLLILSFRNMAMTNQTKVQDKIFNQDKQFSNFLEATKLLTDKDSTAEAKIAAMFSLADVAKDHQNHIDRIIHVINKELTPLIKIIEGGNEAKTYTTRLQEKHVVKKYGLSRREIKTFNYIKNKLVFIESLENSRETIKNWQYNGNETEKVISSALYVIRKILLEIKTDTFDFSNTIFFDIDNTFYKKEIKKKFIRKNRRIENTIFLDCKLKNINFSKTNFHYCKFINCDLTSSNFNNANLWGTSFINCYFKGTKFDKSECESLELIDCKKLTIQQLEEMEFKNLDIFKENSTNSDIKYLIIIDDKTIENINNSDLLTKKFITLEEYTEWKNSDEG